MIWAILALAGLVAVLLWYTRKAGADATRADVEKANADAGERVAQALADAPRDKRALLERLRDPAKPL